MVFGRSIQGRTFTFAPSGLLRQSNLVMWDVETESWWQQGTFEAIVGAMTGTKLETFPAQVVSFEEFKAAFPNGTVLGAAPFSTNDYNPYYGYDTVDRPFLFDESLDHRLPAMERIVGLRFGEEVRAYPFGEMAKARVVHDKVGGMNIVIFYEPATLSPLDETAISRSRSVGAASVFLPRAGERDLDFIFKDSALVDRQTGSTWNILGQAVDGPLKGRKIPPVFHTQSFWFYWAAIHKETSIYKSPP